MREDADNPVVIFHDSVTSYLANGEPENETDQRTNPLVRRRGDGGP
jgi:hypothetical protein